MENNTKDIKKMNITNYDTTLKTLKTYNIRKTIDVLLIVGYSLFGGISIFSLLNTYHDPILFLKNILFLIAFFGISYDYYLKYTEPNTMNIENNTTFTHRFFIYNICILLYGLLSIFYKDTRFHMNVFYRSFVHKPTINGLELDAILAFIAHSLLITTVVVNNTDTRILNIVYLLFIISYGMSFLYNLLTTTTVKNKLLFYAINLGSFCMLLGYISEIIYTFI